MELSIRKTRSPNGVVILTLGGGIAAGRCDALEREVAALLAANDKRVILDVERISLLDSAGVGTIVACLSHLKKAGGELRISGAVGKVESVLKMTQIDTLVRFFPSAEAAACDF